MRFDLFLDTNSPPRETGARRRDARGGKRVITVAGVNFA
jgi:hypothetical protein